MPVISKIKAISQINREIGDDLFLKIWTLFRKKNLSVFVLEKSPKFFCRDFGSRQKNRKKIGRNFFVPKWLIGKFGTAENFSVSVSADVVALFRCCKNAKMNVMLQQTFWFHWSFELNCENRPDYQLCVCSCSPPVHLPNTAFYYKAKT